MKIANFGISVFLILACGSLTGCGDDSITSSSAAGDTSNNGSVGPSTPTGIITAESFFMLFDPADPAVYDSDINYTQKEVVITINADDFNDLLITSGQTINFKTEWGTFTDSDSCVIENGKCSVTWSSGNPYTAPPDCAVSFTAWAFGEETFFDENDNGQFDQTEIFYDLPEPFLDINGNGSFDGALYNYELIGELIDIINFTGNGAKNGAHDAADGKYTGSLCAPGNTMCTSNTSMVIHTRALLYIQDKFDEPTGEDTNGNGIFEEKQIRFCNN